MTTRIVPHQRAIDALVKDAGVGRDMDDRIEKVLGKAQDDAPVLTGDYRDELHTEEGPNGERRVVSGLRYGIYVEAETGNLSSALDAAGD